MEPATVSWGSLGPLVASGCEGRCMFEFMLWQGGHRPFGSVGSLPAGQQKKNKRSSSDSGNQSIPDPLDPQTAESSGPYTVLVLSMICLALF